MTNQETFRVRFAPSPTGNPHVGNFRTALYNYLLARHHGGQFLLRIEDTDRERSKKEYEDLIHESLAWMGMDIDEPPVHQSSRIERHKEEAMRLLENGDAYRCRCSQERLNTLREEQKAAGKTPKYDGHCRDANHPDDGQPFCVRLKTPTEGSTILEDMIRGKITISNNEIDDLIIVRTNGSPTYNFAVVVDDHDMSITHVIRGDDHINNTLKQINLFRVLGYDLPKFAHLPQILGKDKTRLSKRHGATGVLEYRDQGFLPEALLNYMARLGWGHGDQEIFTREQLIELFSLENVNKSAAVFDSQKLEWLDGEHIRALSPDDLAQRFADHLKRKPELKPKSDEIASNPDLLKIIIDCTQVRAVTLDDMIDKISFLFQDDVTYPEDLATKFFVPEAMPALCDLADFASKEGDRVLSHKEWEEQCGVIMKQRDIKMKILASGLRFALTGSKVSPPIFHVIDMLGTKTVVERLRQAIAFANNS